MIAEFSSIREAAEYFGVTKQTIYYRMKKGEKYNIRNEKVNKTQLNEKIGVKLEELLNLLYNMYCVQFLTQCEIAKKLGTTQASISRYIRKYRIVYRLDPNKV